LGGKGKTPTGSAIVRAWGRKFILGTKGKRRTGSLWVEQHPKKGSKATAPSHEKGWGVTVPGSQSARQGFNKVLRTGGPLKVIGKERKKMLSIRGGKKTKISLYRGGVDQMVRAEKKMGEFVKKEGKELGKEKKRPTNQQGKGKISVTVHWNANRRRLAGGLERQEIKWTGQTIEGGKGISSQNTTRKTFQKKK